MVIAIGFQPFLVKMFSESLAYSVHCFALLLRSLFSFFLFGLFLLLQLFTTSFISLFHHYAHLGTFVHKFIRTNHARIYHYDCCAISLDRIGHTTGTHRDQVKTHACNYRKGFGNLILPGPDSSRTWAIQTEPGHPHRSIWLAAGNCACGSLSIREGLINGYHSICLWLRSIAWWLVGCAFYLVLECTCFCAKQDRVYRFWLLPYCIPGTKYSVPGNGFRTA